MFFTNRTFIIEEPVQYNAMMEQELFTLILSMNHRLLEQPK